MKETVSLILQGGHSSEKLKEALFCCSELSKTADSQDIKHSGFLLDLSPQNNFKDNIFNNLELNKAFQKSDILVLSHGFFLQKDILETTLNDWENLVFSNLTFPGICISKILPRFISQNFGRILCFGGTRTETIRGFKTNPVYGAAKTGLASLVKSVAQKYSKHNVTCNLVCPGFVGTEFLSQIQKEKDVSKMPLQKLISVEEISKFAISILETQCLNGALINFDQGWSPNFFQN